MLKGLGQLGDMAKMMKPAQEMQSRMAEVQARLDAIEVDGEAGAGLVKVTATAKGELKALSIDPSIFVARGARGGRGPDRRRRPGRPGARRGGGPGRDGARSPRAWACRRA